MNADPSRRVRWLALGMSSLALLIAAVTFLPWAAWLGTIRSDEWRSEQATLWAWITWLTVVVPAVVVLAAVAGRRIDELFDRGLRRANAVPASWIAAALAILALVASALLSGTLFAHNPHLVDTIAQLFQAKIFVGGALTAPAPPQLEFFAASHLVAHGGRWFSQYPPGHPALLAVGVLIGAPWLVNPLFAGATVLLLYASARRLLGEGNARIAALLYLMSPFALFMSASYMNHVTTGFFLAASLYATVRLVDEGGYAFALLTGISLALAMTIRPLESAAWALVLGFWILLRRGMKPAAVAALAGLVGLVPLFSYNAIVNGHPLRFGYTLLWGSQHGLGFHTDPWGEPFTPLISFANTALDFARLNDYLFEWPFPSLIFLLAATALAARSPASRRALVPLVALLLAAPVAYFFYWHRDNYLGPRFLFASLAPAVMLSAAGIAALDRWMDRWRPAFRLLLLAGILYGLAHNVPEDAGVISGLEPEMKLQPEVQLADAGVADGIVFVKVGWGSRLIGRLWGWGVPASEVERSYRLVDGCRILGALDSADSAVAAGADSALARDRLRSALGQWRGAALPLESGLLPDPSVPVDTTTVLTPACQREVALDRSGFTLYETTVWRDDPWLERGPIFARFLEPQRDLALLARYPGWSAYLYAPLNNERGAVPQLMRLDLESPIDSDSSAAAGESGP